MAVQCSRRSSRASCPALGPGWAAGEQACSSRAKPKCRPSRRVVAHRPHGRDPALKRTVRGSLERDGRGLGHAVDDADVAHVYVGDDPLHHPDRTGRARHDAGAQAGAIERGELRQIQFRVGARITPPQACGPAHGDTDALHPLPEEPQAPPSTGRRSWQACPSATRCCAAAGRHRTASCPTSERHPGSTVHFDHSRSAVEEPLRPLL